MDDELRVGAKCPARSITAVDREIPVPDTCADSLGKCAVLNRCVIFLTHAGV